MRLHLRMHELGNENPGYVYEYVSPGRLAAAGNGTHNFWQCSAPILTRMLVYLVYVMKTESENAHGTCQ